MGRQVGFGLVSGFLLATGCAQIAGIDSTSGGDAPTDRVSLTLSHRSIGATQVVGPQDLSALEATFLIPNDAATDGFDRVPAETLAAGVWSADVGDAMPYVQFSAPDYPLTTQRIFEMPMRNTKGQFAYFEHGTPTPAPAGATIQLSATVPTPYAGEALVIVAVGPWWQRAFTVAELPAVGATTLGPVTFPYVTTDPAGVVSTAGRPLEKIQTTDAVMVLRYVGTKLTGVMSATPFEQTGADVINGTMNAVVAGETLDATFNTGAQAARYAPLRPAMTNPTMVWRVVAAPAYDLASLAGVQLDATGIAATDPSTVAITYGNPFGSRMWKTMLAWTTVANRTFTPMGAVGPITLSAGLNQFAEPTGTAMTFDSPVALPELVTIDSTPLSRDGVDFALPTKAVKVKISVPTTPASELYQLNMYELVPNAANTSLQYKLTVAVFNTSPDLVIPAAFFELGKSYTIRAHAMSGGFPNLATGDFETRTLPYSVGYLDSGVFTVIEP